MSIFVILVLVTLTLTALVEDGKPPETLKRGTTEGDTHTRFTVVLDKIEHMPALMTISRFLQSSVPASRPHSSMESKSEHGSSSSSAINQRVSVDALRLIELSDRTSAMMKSAAADELIQTDSLLAVYQTFGVLNDLPVSASMSIVTQDSFATSVSEHADSNETDMVCVIICR